MKISTLFLAFMAFHLSWAMFEDQAFKFDWKQEYIGSVEDVLHFSKSSKSNSDLLVVRTSSNVLAGLDGYSGQILWRQLSTKDEQLLDLKLEENSVKTLSFDSSENATSVRTWNVLNGALQTEDRYETVLVDQVINQGNLEEIQAKVDLGFIHQGLYHLVHITEHNGLKIHVIHDEDKKVVLSFSTGAGDDKNGGFSCTVLPDTLVCLSNLMNMVYSTKLPLSGNKMNAVSLPTLGVKEMPLKGEFFSSKQFLL